MIRRMLRQIAKAPSNKIDPSTTWPMSEAAPRTFALATPALRCVAVCRDIIKTIRWAMGSADHEADVAKFASHGEQPPKSVLSRLLDRGPHSKPKSAAYAVIDFRKKSIDWRFARTRRTGFWQMVAAMRRDT